MASVVSKLETVTFYLLSKFQALAMFDWPWSRWKRGGPFCFLEYCCIIWHILIDPITGIGKLIAFQSLQLADFRSGTVLVGANFSKKVYSSVVSNRIGMKFGRIVYFCSSSKSAQLRESDLRYDVIISRCRPWRPFTQENAVLLYPYSEWKRSVCRANMYSNAPV